MKTKQELRRVVDQCEGVFVGNSRTTHQLDDVGFLVEIAPKNGARARFELRQHPVMSAPPYFEAVLFGEVDDGAFTVYALGCAVVTEVAANGRARVKPLWDAELFDALRSLAYEELYDEWHDRDD